MRAWDAEEMAWAYACRADGASFDEIAEAAGRTVEDVREALRPRWGMTRREQLALAHHEAGRSDAFVGRVINPHASDPKALGRAWIVRGTAKRAAYKGFGASERRHG